MADPIRTPDASPDGHKAASRPRVQSRAGNVLSVAFGRRGGQGRAAARTAHERAFLPAALEVVETPPSPTLRLTSFALCGLCAAAVLWASLARIDEVAVASGKVIPLGQIKVVQPLETSAIRAIHVDDGDHVRAGDLLVDLDPTEVRADLGQLLYDQGQAALDAEVARLLATGDPRTPFAVPDNVDATLGEANHAQAVAEIAKQHAQAAGIASDIAQRKAALEANVAQVARAGQTLPLLEEKRATSSGLWDKRMGVRTAVLDSTQAVVEKKAELASAEAEGRRLAAETRSLELKLEEMKAGYAVDASDRRTKALQKLADLTHQIAKIRSRESYKRLASPVDGTVQNVKIHTPGAVVTTADTLMTIVPDGTGIEIEAQVENKDIGFVREGQQVAVKYDAFPFTRYGLADGIVRRLGRDAVQGATSGPGAGNAAQASQGVASTPTGELSYPARVKIAQDWILIDGHRETIQPGMRVSAEIKTGDRRVIEYLLSPVMQAVSEAGRER